MKKLRVTMLAALAVSITSVRADLTANLLASADTSISQCFRDNNFGATVEIQAGTITTGHPTRALFKFDITQIPTNATITSAALRIIVTKKRLNGAGSTFDLHRILKDWGEGVGTGNQGSLANPGEATWNNRFHPSTPWTPAGGGADVDYISAASSSTFLDAEGPYTFSST